MNINKGVIKMLKEIELKEIYKLLLPFQINEKMKLI